jgi:uncharacterized membrane protein (UPF0127 family)
VVGLITGCLLLVAAAAAACPLQLPTINLDVNGVQLELEIAATPEERQCGLSGRDTLGPDTGMLFVLPETMPLAVWMKNTRLPLDIAFLDEYGRIVGINPMDPQHKDLIHAAPQPVRFAIEVHRGWFDRRHIRVGDFLEIDLPKGLLIR